MIDNGKCSGDDICSLTNSITHSSTSSDDKIITNRRRYNKMFLFKNYSPSDVSSQTSKKYNAVMRAAAADMNMIMNANTTESFLEKVDHCSISIENESNSSCYREQIGNHECDNSSNPEVAITDDAQEENPSDSHLLNVFPPQENEIQNNNSEESIYNNNINESDRNDSDGDDSDSNCSNSENNYSDSDSSNNTDFIEDVENNFFDRIMFPASNLSIRSIILMCTAFALRFQLSDEALSVLISILKICAGPEFVNVNISKYLMSKCFSSQSEYVIYHYYCAECKDNIIYSVNATKKLKSYNVVCDKCEAQNCIISNSRNYFITVDLKYQLEVLFSNKKVVSKIFENIIENDNVFFEQKIYNKSNDMNKNKTKEVLLTLNVNTDGAPLTRSGQRGFWPLQIAVNRLLSLKSWFILLAGLLLVEKEPKTTLMNLYLSKFVDQIKSLYNDGIEVMHDAVKYVVKFCTLSFPVDSVCRPILQNRVQFNGYFGCSWCYQYCKYIQSAHGIRYISNQVSILRTHESHLYDIEQVSVKGDKVRYHRGVKGFSVLLELPHFDIIWSFPFEYMHGLLLGVVLQLKNLWKNKECVYRIADKKLTSMENQYLKITPTHEIHRLPRSGIIKGNTKPKASELKSWLLYFSLPLLKDVLDPVAFNHYILLVKSAYILLTTDITTEDLDECEIDLIEFVYQFENLYGEYNMTFNVHSLMHCVQSVRKCGPLFLNSAFPYESSIYNLKQYINGPTGMDRQIARKHLQKFLFVNEAKDFIEGGSEEIVSFCRNMFAPKRLTSYYEKIENVTFCGKKVYKNYDETSGCISFNKCIYKGTVYHTLEYTENKKNDDSVVQLNSNEFYRIHDILQCNNNLCKLKLALITCVDDPFHGIRDIKQVKEESLSSNVFRDISEVKRKIVIVKVHNNTYLCTIPNNLEVQ